MIVSENPALDAHDSDKVTAYSAQCFFCFSTLSLYKSSSSLLNVVSNSEVFEKSARKKGFSSVCFAAAFLWSDGKDNTFAIFAGLPLKKKGKEKRKEKSISNVYITEA